MAMMDNADFLISHIRNSYITSDDTGMCEMIIESEDLEKQQGDKRPTSWHAHSIQLDSSFSDSGFEHSDNELSHSYDIFPDMDYGAHRRRSNTAQRLERMKKEKRSQIKVKHISWKDIPPEFSVAEKGHLFEKVTLPSADSVDDVDQSPKKSLLSDQLENFSSTSDNPFLEFAKYDGRANLGAGVKKIEIFLTMAPPRDRPYPMTVVVLSTAKVQDLVGLICWQYTSEGREPKLFENVDCYGLYIAEDDGEVDVDFPSLDSREPIHKFGFGKLALVEKSPPPRSPNSSALVVTITIPNRGFSKIPVENLEIPLKDLLEKVLKKRKIKLRPGMNYNLEKLSDPGLPLDLDSQLSAADTLELCLVRQHSSRGDSDMAAPPSDHSTEALSSHQYKSFMVEMVNKFRTNTEVQLGISGEKVEIDPVARKGAGRIFKQKPITYDADMIAACEKMEEKSTGKSVFRMTYYTGHEYKHQDFESEAEIAEEIIDKLNNILELRLSTVRKEYLATKKRHLKKRESLR